MRRIAVGALSAALLGSMQVPVAPGATSVSSPTSAVQPRPTRGAASPAAAVSCSARLGDLRSAGTTEPWAERVLGFRAAWTFTTGRGQRVAVVDSGVSSTTQLAGRVSPGQSLTGTDAGLDCQGHGTGVAGIIAAAPERGNPFVGVAPAAQILSIKVTDQEGVNASYLAQGIVDAVNEGAGVINVSDQVGDTPELRQAVTEALRNDVVIVAAAGNADQTTGSAGPFYPANYAGDPAAYPNVVSVGAVDPNGTVPDFAKLVKTVVSVVAPGAGIVTAAPGDTFKQQDGTSFAAPFVAGVAALVRAAHPRLTAAEVVSRVTATADGGTVAGTGAGLVNPLQAVTAVLPGESHVVTPEPARSPSTVAIDRAPASDRFGRMLVASIAGGALGAAALVIAGAAIVPAGRRRGWKPGRRNEKS